MSPTPGSLHTHLGHSTHDQGQVWAPLSVGMMMTRASKTPAPESAPLSLGAMTDVLQAPLSVGEMTDVSQAPRSLGAMTDVYSQAPLSLGAMTCALRMAQAPLSLGMMTWASNLKMPRIQIQIG